jgi:peptidoglycan/LPS O-acetylase OafA/YrhL
MPYHINSFEKDGLASGIFDSIRFIAAFCVLSGHTVSRFFGAYNPENNSGISEQLFRVIFAGYGSPAVMVFFVMSGLFIGSSTIIAFNKNNFNLRNYILRRLLRLWIVVIPGLALTLILDYVGITFFTNDLMYSGSDSLGSIDTNSLNMQTFIGNLFFVQTILVNSFGTNSALWSLANEFWYYMAFPFLFMTFTPISSLKKVICSGVLLLLGIFVGVDISMLFVIWLFGVLTVTINWPEFFGGSKVLFGLLFMFLAVMVYHRLFTITDDKLIERFLIGILFLGFAISLVKNDRKINSKASWFVASRKLAAFSFTLYVVHTPVISFARALLIGNENYWEVTIPNITLFLLVLAMTVLISKLIADHSENYTHIIYQKRRI